MAIAPPPRSSPRQPAVPVGPQASAADAASPAEPALAADYAAFDLLATLVAVVAPDGTLRSVNAALESALGQSRHALHGQPLTSHVAEPDALAQALQSVARDDCTTLRYDTGLLRPGVEPLPVHAVLTRTDRPDRLLVEMLPLEAQARHARENRLAAQALAAKALVRGLAHEIRNPLGGLRGAAQLLEMDLADAAQREYTQVIIREADRLQALVNRLLEPHRSAPTLGAVNIHEVCEHVRSLIVAEFGQGLRIERDYDVSIPLLRGDREQLIQALLNIVRNAAQALQPRRAEATACITLRTRIARQVTLDRQRHKLALELLVSDNGPGIAPELLEQIFYPLVTGRPDGTGLGLTLAQTFVRQHGGLIECESAPGKTTFAIVLPLPEAGAAAEDGAPIGTN